MPEVSGISLRGPASVAPRVAPHENHDWSSVGIFKGPSIRRPLKCPVHPHSACGASAGVLNPDGARLALMWCASGLVRAVGWGWGAGG